MEQTIIRQSLQMGRPLPKRIQDAPELRFGLDLYYGAFFDLNSCRMSGWAEGPIPWTSIKDYCIAHELDDEQIEDMFYLVRAMDNAYLDFHLKKAKRGKSGGVIGKPAGVRKVR